MSKFNTGIVAIVLLTALLCPNITHAQQNATLIDTTQHTATVVAGKAYQKGWLGRFLWGSHYRKEWTMPVTVPRTLLDTLQGGVRPIETGGGRQTKNLRLDAPNKRQYAIRSVNKDYGKALPEVAQGTFIETIVKDQMSVAHPYASPTIPILAKAAGVYSTGARIFFIGDDERLGVFRDSFRNDLYSFEDRPTEKNARFYAAKDVLDTEDFLEKLLKHNHHRADALSYARARLFDMFLSDWDRHDDQWKWALYEKDNQYIYIALPKDRDQAYSKFDGLLLRMAVSAANLPYLQGFHRNIKDIDGFNYEARPLDMQITASMSRQQWLDIARQMQQSLTDAVITSAIQQLPPEVFAISGNQIIATLKARRDHLTDFALRYYQSLAKNTDIIATQKDELVLITGVDDRHVKVELFDLNRNDQPKQTPFFSRVFDAGETDEIRIYGIGGNDQYKAIGTTGKQILIRLIGSPQRDRYNIPSGFGGRIHLYDNTDNEMSQASARKYISDDTAIHYYDRKGFKLNKSGFGPRIGYTNEDRIFIGLGYKLKKQQWRKQPFGYSHDAAALYSINQQAWHFIYKGIFTEAIGKWNIGLLGEYDLSRDAHFMGIGNNAVKSEQRERRYYLYHNKEINAALNMYRIFDSVHTVSMGVFYQGVQLLNEPGTYLNEFYYNTHLNNYSMQHFAGARLDYDYTKINDPLVPNKGIRLHAGAEYNKHLNTSDQFIRFSGLFGFYVPAGPFTLAVKTGAATMNGDAQFYQLNKLGGGPTLRGYSRFRFYGKTAFYNQNELQWNFNIHTYLFSGKMGLIALFDNGRVWNPGETSNTWYTAIGGGIMLVPFNKISITGTYAVSKEDQRISVRIGHFLRR